MADLNHELLPLDDVVEVDKAYVGGAPKSLLGAYNPPGKGCSTPMVLVAASRDGQARAKFVPDDQRATLEPALAGWIVSDDITLMADGSTSYLGIDATMEEDHYVIHSQHEYANPETGAMSTRSRL